MKEKYEDDIIILAAEIAEWSDRATVAMNMMLNRGGDEERAELRAMLSEWHSRFIDTALDIQNTFLSGNGWVSEKQGDLWGWIDPSTNVHYLPKDAIALQRLRAKKRFAREPRAYN